ncbi:MAG: DUF3352 domain-containing protein, partial [Thermoleophilaceae bacterium]|nr:DUF3352 domain-containing protein [Thermoleophilaceae bacterium]
SYEGADYVLDNEDDAAIGVVGAYVILARNEVAFKKAVDAEKGDSLADDQKFKDAKESAADDSVAFLYADPKGLLNILRGVPGFSGPQAQALQQLPGFNSDQPATASLTATDDKATFQTTQEATPEVKKQAEDQPDVGGLPGDAWAALATGSAGGSVEQQLKTLPQQQRNLIDQQLKQATGLTIEELIGWIDSFELYARGTSISDLGFGLTLGSSDPAQSKKAVLALAKLARQQVRGQAKVAISGDKVTISSPQVPGAVTVEASGDEVKASYGAPVSGKLSDSAKYKAATGSLDGAPASFFLDPGPITNLIAGVAGSDPDYQQAKPVLEKFDYLVGGTKIEGDKAVGRFVIGVK